jgi:hypothetical protein
MPTRQNILSKRLEGLFGDGGVCGCFLHGFQIVHKKISVHIQENPNGIALFCARSASEWRFSPE